MMNPDKFFRVSQLVFKLQEEMRDMTSDQRSGVVKRIKDAQERLDELAAAPKTPAPAQ